MRIKTASFGFITGLFLLGSIIIGISLISQSRTNQVQGIWLEFESHRSDRLRALIALRSELGYGGMIHQFKNYILRQNQTDSKSIISSIGGAKAALVQYKYLQLNAAEKRAISHIETILDAYQTALNQINQLILQQKTAKQIDHIVRIDDSDALEALKLLELETKLINSKTFEIQRRSLLLSSLRTAMGYGGLIHNFKNYILRHSPEAFNNVIAESNRIESLVEIYRTYELSTIEKKSLSDILNIVKTYQKNLLLIQEMSIKGDLPRAIDKVVIINDALALEGFKNLYRETIKNNESRAKQLNDALQVVHTSSDIIFYLTLISFVFFIFLALWIMNCLIVAPISRLTNIMSRLSNNDLNVIVSGTLQKSEIGTMARSVEVFKTNAIKKQEAENALLILNDQLEEKVNQRTQKLKDNEVRLAAMAEHAVEGEERLKILINTAMDAVIQIDDKGCIVIWNKQAEFIFGWSSHETLGLNLHELIIPESYREQHTQGLKRFLATEKATILNTRIETTALNRGGNEFPIELSISPIKYKGRYQFSAFVRDITEQKKSALALLQAKDEAETANRAKSNFLANMSHELRTPMHGILSFAKFGIKKSETETREKLHKYFSNINTSAERLLVLLNNLLDLSKLEAGKIELNKSSGDLSKVFSTCYNEQAQHIKDRGLTLSLIEPDCLMSGLFDQAYITQVVANLLSNAIKFSPKNSTLTVRIFRNEQQLCFSLLDEGEGIPEDELKSVFNAFIQSSKTKTSAGGTGLGLAICKEIIEAHKGKIWAKNGDNGGALFKFTIPC